jgi:OPA family glycerol-3-phosphate transporter-like MFS transporter
MFGIFKPQAHIERLSPDRVESAYTRLRWQLFIGIFVGYAGYYPRLAHFNPRF